MLAVLLGTKVDITAEMNRRTGLAYSPFEAHREGMVIGRNVEEAMAHECLCGWLIGWARYIALHRPNWVSRQNGNQWRLVGRKR